jgi:hypothetical protein
MATILGSVTSIIHDTSAALIDQQITKKVSDLVTTSVTSAFAIVEDLLGIVKDLTEETDE